MAINVNNEEIGISAEVAIARTFGVDISNEYIKRADIKTVNILEKHVKNIFETYNIPDPIKHIAEGQNPVDFKLNNEKTLSVKTNQNKLGKSAPQKVGQPTKKTYYDYFKDFIQISEEEYFKNPEYYFKKTSLEKIEKVINVYWKNIFECDYLILFYNIISKEGEYYNLPKYKVFGKYNLPIWNKEDFSFTQTIETWNESVTLKYKNIRIGEFQAHKNRDCFKFRFDMKGILRLIQEEKI